MDVVDFNSLLPFGLLQFYEAWERLKSERPGYLVKHCQCSTVEGLWGG